MEVTQVTGGALAPPPVVPAAGKAADPTFASVAELHQVLDGLLCAVDTDPDDGPWLQAANVAHRFRFPDLGTVLNVTGTEGDDRCIEWEFSDDVAWKPELTLEMDSAIANRFLQGAENLAIAVARRRITFSCGDARAAMSFLPTSSRLIPHYRGLVAREYPHLTLS